MAGGNFTSQNKIRPGAYINFKGTQKTNSILSDRGIVALPVVLNFGEPKKVIELTVDAFIQGNELAKLGIKITDKVYLQLREVFKNSQKVLLYRLNDGTKASVELNSLIVVARYGGTYGNEIRIKIDAVAESAFKVSTIVANYVVDEQTVTSIEALKGNDYVTFSGTGVLTETAGISLSGGSQEAISSVDYQEFFGVITNKTFNTIGIYTEDDLVKSSLKTFVENLRDSKGKKIQGIVNDYALANYEGIISVNQGYQTKDYAVDVEGFVAYVAGVTAGANVNESNTYHEITQATEIINPLTDEAIETALRNGEFILTYRSDEQIIIEKDINTLTVYSADKNQMFSKNRPLRVLDEVNNSIKLKYEKSYIGKVDNNAEGRNLLKAEIIAMMTELQNLNAIRDFTSEDVQVTAGVDIDSVVVDLAIYPVDAMEKMYLTVMVN